VNKVNIIHPDELAFQPIAGEQCPRVLALLPKLRSFRTTTKQAYKNSRRVFHATATGPPAMIFLMLSHVIRYVIW
jgi:hypothetical protein